MKKALLFTFICLISCSKPKLNQDLIVKDFDLNRYLGTWYEIARYDNRFEKNLVDVVAEYKMKSDGNVEVINSGYNPVSKEHKSIKGVAKIKDKNIGKLRVSFFRPFYADYNIILLDKDYQYAVVAGSDLKNLWILSRNKEMAEDKYLAILKKIRSFGILTDTLRKY